MFGFFTHNLNFPTINDVINDIINGIMMKLLLQFNFTTITDDVIDDIIDNVIWWRYLVLQITTILKNALLLRMGSGSFFAYL